MKCRNCGEPLEARKLGSYFEYTHLGEGGWCHCAPHWRYTKGIRRDDLTNSFAEPLTGEDIVDKLLAKYTDESNL